jgi:hypothetical protein
LSECVSDASGKFTSATHAEKHNSSLLKEKTMNKKEQSGFFGKLFGGLRKENCCAIEIVEIPAIKPDSEKETTEKQSKESHQNNYGCGCCR